MLALEKNDCLKDRYVIVGYIHKGGIWYLEAASDGRAAREQA